LAKAKPKAEDRGRIFMNLLTHPVALALLFLGVWALLSYLMIANRRQKAGGSAIGWIAFSFAVTALAFGAGILRTYMRSIR
jgi:hypothetical protein